MPARRRAWVPGASSTNGAASSRADTASRDCSVADQLGSGRRGGNCVSSAAAAGTEPAPGPIRRPGFARSRCALPEQNVQRLRPIRGHRRAHLRGRLRGPVRAAAWWASTPAITSSGSGVV